MKDEHIVRYLSSLITISDGKVVNVTKPVTSGCRMAHFLYKGLKNAATLTSDCLKEEIRNVIEDKITRFGFCTKDRMVWEEECSVPYGASEIIAYGLKNKTIDCAVTVCDGVGTVITNVPQVVQGIGARMHAVLKTSFIPEVAVKLRRYGCQVLDDKGLIAQAMGVAAAAEEDFKNIAVTVCAFSDENLEKIRVIEKNRGISATILVVCTTGIKKDRLKEIEKHADIVWACNSSDIRNRLNKKTIKTLSSASPVYILTEKGEKLISGYMPGVFGMREDIKKRVLS